MNRDRLFKLHILGVILSFMVSIGFHIKKEWAGLIARYKEFWHNKAIFWETMWSIVIFVLSLAITYFSVVYANTFSNGNKVQDIILDNIPTFDVNFLFFQGGMIFILLATLIVLYNPKSISFAMKATALFFAIRSLFTILTHLSAPILATYTYIDFEDPVRQALFTFTSGNDLFFSGHAGYPFFMAMIFWKDIRFRIFFLAMTIFGSAIVLLGHLHYSIDVFSAFFIGYGIFEISKRIFKYNYNIYLS